MSNDIMLDGACFLAITVVSQVGYAARERETARLRLTRTDKVRSILTLVQHHTSILTAQILEVPPERFSIFN